MTYHIGDIVPFGQYPQGANGEIMPLEWRVLDVQNDRALLLADKLIDCKRYHEEWVDVTWETCTLRQWLNSEFISKAFNSGEQSKIATVTNQNPNNPKYGTTGGNSTQDRVFALSIDEVKKYFSSDSAMIAYATLYTKTQGVYVNKDTGGSWWWLRSRGSYHDIAAGVYSDGGVDFYGDLVGSLDGAARPAFRLNL